MFKNHFKIALRSLARHKGYSFINILGLTIGIAACFFILLWVQDERSYDRFHEKSDRIYRVLWEARFGDNEWKLPLVPVPVAETLEREFPEVERAARLYKGGMTLRLGEAFVREQNFLFTEPAFFEVFTTTFLAGDAETALTAPNSIVLTESAAQRYFPNRDPIGQTIEQNDGRILQVTGVIRDFPTQSHFHFEFMASLENLRRFTGRRGQWGSASVYTYLALRPGEDISTLQQKLQTYVDENVSGSNFGETGNFSRFPMQALMDIHLRSHLQYELSANGNIVYVWLFAVIAFFILLLACINFVNLSTAQSMKRSREVGVRKVLGSQKAQLVRQFLAETFVNVALAILLAWLLVETLTPAFAELSSKQFASGLSISLNAFGLSIGVAVLVTLLAGAYPAFFLSSFWPIQAIKGRSTIRKGGEGLRKVLVVAQFGVSISIIFGALVIKDQLNFLQNKQLGFDKDQVLIIHRAGALGDQQETFKQRLLANSQIESVTAAQNLPGQIFDSTIFTPEQPANYENTSLTYTRVDESYVDVLKLKIVEGRNFSAQFASDSSAFLLNQTAAEMLGWQEPLGKQISMGNFAQGPVIGVVEDFHFQSLHNEVKPILFMFNRWRPSYVAVRLQGGQIAEGMAAIKNLWQEFSPDSPLAYSFLDQDFQALYASEERVANVFITFSFLGVFIACLGLFGLISFTAEQRTKEIGVRKVLGASVVNVTTLLSKDFIKLVLIANFAAWPLAWYAMNKWLQNFAYRIDISWPVFALAGGLALVIALFTVSIQAIRAALANPIESLRYE